MFCQKRQSEQGDKHTTDNIKHFSFVGNVLVIIVVAIIAIVICGTAIWFGVANLPANRLSRYMGAAERYLREMNYEQAIIEFERLLEIDPMNEDAIIGLADAYASMGNIEKAIEVLNDGYELTRAARIESRLNKLRESPTSSSTESSNNIPSLAASPNSSVEANPAESISLNYLDVSDYFDSSDVLSNTAGGQIITAAANNDYNIILPYKSVFLSDDSHITELNEVFTSGMYCTEDHILVGHETPNLVHENGTQHVYKATSNGTELIKTSPYPMYVTQDGYIAYYASRNDSSVTVNIQSPSGEIVSSTQINSYSDPTPWLYGSVVDRLSTGDSLLFSRVDTKGAPFAYHLYTEYVRNTVTGNYDTKWVRYLFYTTGEVVLDEVIMTTAMENHDASSYPEKITHSGKTYLSSFGNVTYFDNDVEIVEYHDSNYTPIDILDGYYIEPEYAAFVLMNIENGECSQLYKELSSAGNELFIATDFDGLKCYLDKNGHEISIKYADIGAFCGEFAFALENGIYYLIDRNFDKLLKIEGSDVKNVGDNMFSCVKHGKVHLVRVR